MRLGRSPPARLSSTGRAADGSRLNGLTGPSRKDPGVLAAAALLHRDDQRVVGAAAHARQPPGIAVNESSVAARKARNRNRRGCKRPPASTGVVDRASRSWPT